MSDHPDAQAMLNQSECASCGVALTEPFGWCSNCRQALCLACARRHFCRPTCAAAGCIAGLCVRLVENGRISARWGSPTAPGDHLNPF